MQIRRVWAMPNRNTFSIKPIGDLLGRYATDNSIDPFANESKVAAITNDIDSEYDTDYHLNATDFMDLFDDWSIDLVLLDPPYSSTQVMRVYRKLDKTVTGADTRSSFWANIKNKIARVLSTEGVVISFGWNTNGMGKSRGFKVVEILMVHHGAQHNDTLVTVEKRIIGETT